MDTQTLPINQEWQRLPGTLYSYSPSPLHSDTYSRLFPAKHDNLPQLEAVVKFYDEKEEPS